MHSSDILLANMLANPQGKEQAPLLNWTRQNRTECLLPRIIET
jgi:hypothetical protein